MRIFDTHAHYDDKAFDGDRDALLSSMQKSNIIEAIVNVGASMNSSKTTISLTEEYPFLYGAIGVHPEEVTNLTERDMEWLREQSRLEKIVAIGEIGLDYYWDDVPKDIQQAWFERQLELAKEVKMPVIIHSREAANDTLAMLTAADAKNKLSGIIHCYSYSKENAKDYLDMGFYFGIGGVVTFKNAKKIKEAVSYIPIEQIVLETDCPYLAPMPYRGERNFSENLSYVAQEIAMIKNLPYEEVLEQTNKNARAVYQLQKI